MLAVGDTAAVAMVVDALTDVGTLAAAAAAAGAG